MKRCSKCGEEKPLDAFPPIRRSGIKLQSWCRTCFAAYGADYYQRNREAQKAHKLRNVAAARDAKRRQLIDYLLLHPCIDCGEKDIVVLEFDHLREKEFDVARLVNGGATWRRVEREIAKCEVRCANCHRRKTAERGQARRNAKPLYAGRLSPVEQLLLDDLALRSCRRCRRALPLTCFPYRSKKDGTRHHICLDCQRELSHDWYVRTCSPNAERHLGYATRLGRQKVLRVDEYLGTHPCVDCGEDNVIVLEFDHVRGRKEADVSTLTRAGADWPVIEAEIAKCDVRCANCHRRRTVERINGYRIAARTNPIELSA